MKKCLILIIITCLLAIAPAGQAETWQDSFQHQIWQWSTELGKQDQRFTAFSNSTFTTQTLGPNSKIWLVIFQLKDSIKTTAGYMVVTEVNEQLELLEYGLGEDPLFDRKSVEPFLPDDAAPLTPSYAGLESVWTTTEDLFDAKSGEKYPPSTKQPTYQVQSTVKSGDKLEKVYHKSEEVKDSLTWAKPSMEIREEDEFMNQLAQTDMAYLAFLFDKTVRAPFTVTGFHQWNKKVFVELEDYGSRFIPFDYARSLGQFLQ